MKALVEKLVALEKEISEERDAFALFGIFEREEASGKWDLVVAASWFGDDKKKVLEYLARKLRQKLKQDELLILAGIVTVDVTDASVRAIQKAFHVEHGMAEVKDSVFFGMPIKHAYIITSQAKTRDGKPVPV
jgi:hypothetical protein